jgi:hypothetical protein
MKEEKSSMQDARLKLKSRFSAKKRRMLIQLPSTPYTNKLHSTAAAAVAVMIIMCTATGASVPLQDALNLQVNLPTTSHCVSVHGERPPRPRWWKNLSIT